VDGEGPEDRWSRRLVGGEPMLFVTGWPERVGSREFRNPGLEAC
jgi:hypothetical protein